MPLSKAHAAAWAQCAAAARNALSIDILKHDQNKIFFKNPSHKNIFIF